MAKVFQVDTAGTLLTGLVSYYKLDDVNDYYGTKHLTDVGAVPFIAGKIGNCAQLSGGTNRSLSLASPWTTAVDNFSMFCWVYMPTTSESGRIMTNGTPGINGISFGVGANNYLAGAALYILVEALAWIVPAISLSAGWNYVGIIRSAGVCRGYVNNTAGGTTGATTPNTPAGAAYIGAVGVYNPFTGYVDEAAIWSKALSAQERTDLYNGGAGQTMVESGTVIPIFNSIYRRRRVA